MRISNHRFWICIVATLVLSVSCLRARSAGPTGVAKYVGLADVSAGVALTDSLFVVGDDEENVLCVYDRRNSERPIARFDLSPHLNLEAKSPEVDIEAAAKLDQRVYWLSSHGTNKNGKIRLNRRRLFATEFKVENGRVAMRFVGKPYSRLVDDLTAAPELKKYDFAKKAKLAPKTQGGLNIEGLATSPSGDLLIGFRSPLHDGRAIVIPLTNPRQVIEGERARFGAPIELDLGKLGVRGMEYSADGREYVIVAGPQATGICRLFTWSGNVADVPKAVEGVDLRAWNPEACIPNQQDQVQLLSDDGVKENKLAVPTFRSASVRL